MTWIITILSDAAEFVSWWGLMGAMMLFALALSGVFRPFVLRVEELLVGLRAGRGTGHN